ncbi:MAG TPA: hypothetical protein VGL92_17215 [Acidimicrobiia bacterium]
MPGLALLGLDAVEQRDLLLAQVDQALERSEGEAGEGRRAGEVHRALEPHRGGAVAADDGDLALHQVVPEAVAGEHHQGADEGDGALVLHHVPSQGEGAAGVAAGIPGHDLDGVAVEAAVVVDGAGDDLRHHVAALHERADDAAVAADVAEDDG